MKNIVLENFFKATEDLIVQMNFHDLCKQFTDDSLFCTGCSFRNTDGKCVLTQALDAATKAHKVYENL